MTKRPPDAVRLTALRRNRLPHPELSRNLLQETMAKRTTSFQDSKADTVRAVTLIGYARVSTSEQDPALQLDALQQAGCQRIFEDKMSGAKTERPGLTQALAYLREGDALVVWKLDRLGRSLGHLIHTIEDLQRRGVGFRSLTEAIDTTTPSGRLLMHVFGALAQFERDLIRERTKAGLSAAAARGRKGGRRPVINDDKLRRAKILLTQGLNVREAAARVKVGKTTLYKALEAEKLAAAERKEAA